MTPEQEFAALAALAREIDPDAIPDEGLDNYVLTLSGTVAIGVDVRIRPRALVD